MIKPTRPPRRAPLLPAILLLTGCAGAPAAAPQCPPPPPAATAAPSNDANERAAAAKAIAAEIRAAGASFGALSERLGAARAQMASRRYPEELVSALSSWSAPSTAAIVDGGALRLPSSLSRPLVHWLVGVAELEKTTQSLRNILQAARAPVEKAWAEQSAPVVQFSVVFRKDAQKGTIAELVPNKEPFPLAGGWPKDYPVLLRDGSKVVEKKATRWTGGALGGAATTAVPVSPESTAAFTGDLLLMRLLKALADTRTLLDGEPEATDPPKPGLVAEGEALLRALAKISD